MNVPVQGPNRLPAVPLEPPEGVLRDIGKEEWRRVSAVQNSFEEGEHWLTIADLGVLLAYCVAFQNFVDASYAVQGWRKSHPEHKEGDASDELNALIDAQERRSKRLEATAPQVLLTPRARQRMNLVMFNEFKMPDGKKDTGRLFLG